MPKTGSQPRQIVYTSIPQETHRNLKAKCAMQGVSISFVVSALMEAYIAGKIDVSVSVEPK
jgi:hypothetical protein